ncbi:MAG TPA: PaaI family thioesterase [Candidatus Binatia bacterium]|nr:PaaI family thioesterase [Candidatus Binatia bacterium]
MADRHTGDEPDAPSARAAGGFDECMGFEYVRLTRDEVVLEYTISDRHLQPYGIVHGGVHCATVETACSTGAALDAMERGQSVVGVENHTSFLRAARSGRVRVTARPLVRGRRSQVWEATAVDERGTLLASGRVRLLCLEAGATVAGEPVEPFSR